MRILAFETSAKAASVALLEDDTLLGELYLNCGLTHSRTLLESAQRLLEITELTAKDIDAMNARINKAADMAKENEQSVAQQDKALIRFSGKFATAMDFIGRNLPLKRKRKAFRKIVEA